MTRRWAALALCAIAAASGCSFVGVRGPHTTNGHREDCTDSNTLPGADTLAGLGIGLGVGLLVYESRGDRTCNGEVLFGSSDCYRSGISLVAGALAAVPWLVSAAWGRSQVKACQEQSEVQEPPSAPVPPPIVDEPAGDPPRTNDGPRLVEAADAEMRQGRYGDAARDYSAAHEATQDPALLYKIGQAHERANECGVARGYYERYLDEAKPDAETTASVQQRIAACSAVR